MSNDARHEEIRSNLPAFALGGLSPEEANAVREHLPECEECRRELAVYAPLTHALDLEPPDAPPASRRPGPHS